MRRLAFILIAALATLALAVPASAETWYGQVFRSPSGNLICKYRASNDSVACGRRNDQRILAMTSYGAAREGYRMDWRGLQVHTLSYGETYRGVGSHITCGSYVNGVRCTNWNGHGFFINRDTMNAW